jgi:Putative peptidoglycan binding domain
VRTKSFILVAASLAVLVVLGGALYAYDRARADEISSGVKVGGIPLGGLTRAQAQARLERDIMAPLERPIVVHHANKTWKLGAGEARIRADLSAMVDQAVARSRSGDVFTRSWRSLTGEKLDQDLRPSVQFSDAAVIRLIDKVRRSVERPAKDASVKISAGGVTKAPTASRSRPARCIARSRARSSRRPPIAPSWRARTTPSPRSRPTSSRASSTR